YALSAKEFLWTAAAAALLSWVGDIFLVKRRGAAFAFAGIAAFFFGNLCYTASILRFSRYPESMAAAIPFVLILASALFAALILLFHAPRGLAAAAALYGLTLAALTVCAVWLFIQRGDAVCAAILSGALCLSASDICLACRYGKMTKGTNFVIMLLYIAAQFSLLPGLARLV
ncbi:MAG: lysoplasmalogenase family protein, partial [Spirochaetaceae bacterium]|nr:lysoplasmalogenase family protein [Spirochaetaceae bacterium]